LGNFEVIELRLPERVNVFKGVEQISAAPSAIFIITAPALLFREKRRKALRFSALCVLINNKPQ